MPKNDLWEPRRRIETEYRNAIRLAMRKLGALLTDLQDPADIMNVLLSSAQQPWFNRYAEAIAMKMVTHTFSDTGRTWREAAAKNGQGRALYNVLMREMSGPLGTAMQDLVAENANYIKSVPESIARQMASHIMEAQLSGARPEDIARELRDIYPDLSDVKANLIARTEAAKTSSNLVQARSEIMGVEWYRWQTSEDSRVRISHRKMDKVLVNWYDAPSPEALAGEKSYGRYAAGCTFNCRCYPEAVIDLERIEWPARVYRNGSITRMTRREFERLLPRKQKEAM